MTDPTGPRPWDVRELAAGDVRGIRRRPADGQRVVGRITGPAEGATTAWRSTDRWSRAVIRELDRLGHDPFTVGQRAGQIYATGVGRARMTLVITFDVEGFQVDDFTILRVTFGRETWTARQAALWLKARAAR